MKRIANRGLALLMAVLMCFSLLTVTGTHAHAANNWVYNWGTRGEAATELSESALAFYTGANSYASISQLPGGTSYTNAPSSALYSALKTLMTQKHTYVTSYDATRSMFAYTDCQNGGNPSTISSFYSGKAIGPDWDSGATWNREHTWPNSKGNGDAENDIMMLRPTSSSENSSRGNTAYGESSGYYNPNSESNNRYDLRGDVARIMLYVYTRWGNTYAMWGTDGVIESQSVLLKWVEEDPVDTWELGRNDSVQSITGTRNVFVDYPELAFLLFGQTVPADMSTPSNGQTPSGHTCSYDAGVVTAPTCTAQGYTTYTCTDPTCGKSHQAEFTNKAAHNYVNGTCTACGAAEPVVDTSKPATITFDDTSKRTAFDTSKQVWEENGITVTNNKADSTSNVADYAKPARFYANSSLAIAFPGMTKIEVACNSSKYATALKNSITDGSTVTVDGMVVTITLKDTADTFTISKLTAQVRVNSLTVYPAGGGTGGEGGEGGEGGNTGGEVTPSAPAYVTEIAADKAYKLGLYSTSKSAEYYFIGTMSTYYGATSEVYADGVDVFVEETTGGYYLYFVSGGEKQYINLVASGTHLNFTYGATANSVFTWDAAKHAMYTTVGSEVCYMGTYGNYVTVGVLSAAKMKDTDYIARFYAVNSGSGEEPTCEHSWTDATCTAPKTCSKCGDTEGEALGHSYTNGTCLGCGQADPEADEKLSGLAQDVAGNWNYYINGEIATDYTGLVEYEGVNYFVTNGTIIWGINDLVLSGDTWYYVENSAVMDYTGLAQYSGNGNWYYVQNGAIDWNKTDLVQYSGNGNWYYVVNGEISWGTNDLVQYSGNGNWYHVVNGEISWGTNDLVQYSGNGNWYYVVNGEINFGYTGLAMYSGNGNWYYVANGEIDWTYTGTAEYDGNSYSVMNGVVIFS